jgi:hypothetical protein
VIANPCARAVGSRPSSSGTALRRATLPRSSIAMVSRLNTFWGKASASHALRRITGIGSGSQSAAPSPCARR